MADDYSDAFMICPIGAEGSPARVHSDKLMKFIVQPVLEEQLKMHVDRADLIVESGLITSQIFKRLATAPLVLADLSGHNPNVFYELAVRHAVRKPVIHLIAKGESIPFDVANNRTLFYELELEAVDTAKAELRKMVDSALAEDGPVESPISDALERVQLSSSIEPVERRDAELLAMVSDIRTRLGMVEVVTRASLSEPDPLFDLERSIDRFSKEVVARSESGDAAKLLAQLQRTYLTLNGLLFAESKLSNTELSKMRHPTRSGTFLGTHDTIIDSGVDELPSI